MADVQLDATTGFRSIEMAQAIPDMFDIIVAGAGSFGEHLERARALPVEPPKSMNAPEVDRPERARATAGQAGPTVEDRTDQSYGQIPKRQTEAVERAPADRPAPAESTSAEADVEEGRNAVGQAESKPGSDQDENVPTEPTLDGSEEQDTDEGEEQAEVAVVAQPIQMDMAEMVDQNTADGDGNRNAGGNGNANGEFGEGEQSESTAEKQSRAKELSIEKSELTDPSSRQSVEQEQVTETTSVTAASEIDKPDTDRKTVAPEATKQTGTNPAGAKAAETTAETVVAETDVETSADPVTAEQESQENGQRDAKTLPVEQTARTDRPRRSRRRAEKVSRVEQGKAGGQNAAARNDTPVNAPSHQPTETASPTRDLAAATGAELRADAPEASSKPTTTGTRNSQADTAGRVEPGGRTGRARVALSSQAPSEPGQVDRVRFVRRVARAFQTMGDRTGTVRVRLSPPELGSLRLEIAVRNGAMTARIEAETHVARSLLLDNLPALRDRLAQQDIKIEQFDVDLMDRSTNGMPDRTADHAGSEDRRENGRDASGTTNAEDSESSVPRRQSAGRTGEGSQLNVIV